MSAPDIVVHFITQQGPLSAGQIAKQIPDDFPIVAPRHSFANEGIKRAIRKGVLVHTDKGYDLKERAHG